MGGYSSIDQLILKDVGGASKHIMHIDKLLRPNRRGQIYRALAVRVFYQYPYMGAYKVSPPTFNTTQRKTRAWGA